MYSVYQPNALPHTILALVFYVLMFGFVAYSFLTLYTLNKYGRSKILAAAVSLVYVIIIASIFAAAQTSLNNITL